MIKREWFGDWIADRFDEQGNQLELTHKTVDKTEKYLNASDIVLDYACGTGAVAVAVADKVTKIYGIDISSKMIGAAKRKVGERKLENADFMQATIFDESLKRETFDVILTLGILHLVKDAPGVVQRIHELLKPGGLLISVTACMEEMGEYRGVAKILFFLLAIIGPHLRFFKFSKVDELITNGGFQIVETESYKDNPVIYFVAAKKITRT